MSENPTEIYDTCKICASDRIRRIAYSRRTALPIMRCEECGLRFIGRRFTAEEQASIYNDDSAYGAYIEAERAEPKAAGRRQAWLAKINGHLNGSGSRRLCDVGCGAGDFLADARAAGFRVEGLEISRVAADMARRDHGLNVVRATVEQYHPDSQFDVVASFAVLEHVLDPATFLASVSALIKDGGVLFIYMPVWGLYDSLATIIARITRSRLSHFLDRRINHFHLQIYPLSTALEAIKHQGFEILEAGRICEYNLPITEYLRSIGVRGTILRTLTALVERCVDHGLFFRNNQYIVARKFSSGN